MSEIIDVIFDMCNDLELEGMKPNVAIVGGKHAKELKETLMQLAGNGLKLTDSVYKMNYSGNMITIIETMDNFIGVYSNQKINN